MGARKRAKSTSEVIDGQRRVGRPRGTGTQLVYESLREDILRLRRRPGENIDEARLEKELGVSRTPVREALIRLASENLVELTPNRGMRVAYLEIDDVPQVFDALELFQRAANKWCALCRKDSVIHELRVANDTFLEAMRRGDTEVMGDANREFHLAVSRGSGNIYVHRTYESILNVTLRLARTLFARAALAQDQAQYFRQIEHEHEAMIDAIARGDADAAEELAAAHAGLFRNRVMTVLERGWGRDIFVPKPSTRLSENKDEHSAGRLR